MISKNQHLEQQPIPAIEADDLGDDTPVSSEDAGASEKFMVHSEYGEAGQPQSVAPNLEIEPVPNYQGIRTTTRAYRESAPALRQMEAASAEAEESPLDAWYAEFSRPGTAAVLQHPEGARTIAEVTKAILEVVLGTDDRVQIGNTQDFPWRCICALNIAGGDGTRWIGTGWFAGPRTVITAGHCVYMHSHGGWVTSIEVIPGCNDGQRPYDSTVATSFRSVKGWTEKQMRDYDYGAIILPAEGALGTIVGSFGIINLGDSDLTGHKLNLSGYPSDKTRGTQWFHARALDSITARTLVYSIDTAGGQSGSPVWRLENGERHVVGIHTNGDISGNSATRIVAPVFDNIGRWKDEAS